MKHFFIILTVVPWFLSSCKKEEETKVTTICKVSVLNTLTINGATYDFNDCKAYDLDSIMNIFLSDNKPPSNLTYESFKILFVPKEIGTYPISKRAFPYHPPIAEYNIINDSVIGSNYSFIADSLMSYISITKICANGIEGVLQLFLIPDPRAWNPQYLYYPNADSLVMEVNFEIPFKNP